MVSVIFQRALRAMRPHVDRLLSVVAVLGACAFIAGLIAGVLGAGVAAVIGALFLFFTEDPAVSDRYRCPARSQPRSQPDHGAGR